MTQYKAKVADEPDEYVMGELIKDGDRYYIRQTEEPPNSECGIGKFEVVPETVEEVERVAHWVIVSDGWYPVCSECWQEPPGKEMTKYCPNCGARMETGK